MNRYQERLIEELCLHYRFNALLSINLACADGKINSQDRLWLIEAWQQEQQSIKDEEFYWK